MVNTGINESSNRRKSINIIQCNVHVADHENSMIFVFTIKYNFGAIGGLFEKKILFPFSGKHKIINIICFISDHKTYYRFYVIMLRFI